jgi:hypothetical protein
MTEKRSPYQTEAAKAQRELPTLTLLRDMKLTGLPDPIRELRFDENREWPFDLAWPGLMLAVEINGGVWSNGRHTRGKGYIGDMEKLNEAQIQGWCVLQFTPDQAMSGYALDTIHGAIIERRFRFE